MDAELEISVAYHEAGHFVIGHRLGAKFDFISIEPDFKNRTAGRANLLPEIVDVHGKPFNEITVNNRIAILMAGYIAEAVGTSEENLEGAQGDKDMIVKLMNENGISDDELDRLYELVVNMLADNLDALKRIVKELLEQKKLSGNEAAALADCVREE